MRKAIYDCKDTSFNVEYPIIYSLFYLLRYSCQVQIAELHDILMKVMIVSSPDITEVKMILSGISVNLKINDLFSFYLR